ncbi:MAG: hypothetical protein WCO08_08615 [Actinomycetes bacterium]
MDLRRYFPAVVLVAILALAGCAQPSQKYAADKKDGVYFTVPISWKLIPQKAISAREALSTATGAADRLAAVKWQEAYSPSAAITAKDVLSLATKNQPIVYVRVRSLLSDEINAVSYNSLRDIIVPLTTWAAGTDATAPAFTIGDDSEDVQKIARGVHTEFTFTTNVGKVSTSQTIDQTSLVANDRSTLYVLVVRCSASCFEKNRTVLTKISHSFTVRGTR